MSLRKYLPRRGKSKLAFRLNQRLLRAAARRGSPGVVRSARRAEPVVALSYDDGPSPANTPELLEILAAAGARATFFVVGSRARQHRDLVVEIDEGGHELGNHSFSHVDLRTLDDVAVRLELERGSQAIAELAAPSRLFRPPFGKEPRSGVSICAELGLTTVLWSIDSGDTMPFTAARIAEEVVGRVEPGDIVLLHDGGDRRQATLDATRQILSELGARGYRFVTVSELLGSA